MARITVEDCLLKEQNRFSLVVLCYKRAKQVLQKGNGAPDEEGHKSIVHSLYEIADGKVRFMTDEDRERVRQAEEARRAQLAAEAPLGNSAPLLSGDATAPAATTEVGNGNGAHGGNTI